MFNIWKFVKTKFWGESESGGNFDFVTMHLDQANDWRDVMKKTWRII